MVQFIYNVPLYSTRTAGEFVLIKSLNPQPDGKSVLVQGFNDLTLYVAADGSWSWVPLGTVNDSTVATLNGVTLLVFNPTNGAGQPFVYTVVSSVV